jgi:seryl-tRNA synthetase
MGPVRPTARPTPANFLAGLVEHELLIPSGVAGAYGRGAVFEETRVAVDRWITARSINSDPRRMAFPPVLPREHLERIGYLATFPHLAGTIFSFSGDESAAVEQDHRASHGEDWSEFQQQTDLVLVPAACYPVYPAVAARGPLPATGLTIDLGGSYVFRNEPSLDPTRWQMFHQREMVRLGEPDAVARWRGDWSEHAIELLDALGLVGSSDVAADPFFGRAGRMLAHSQREQELKLEVTLSIVDTEPTAVASFNYHRDHFSSIFNIVQPNGELAHTACVGFGLERITLALFSTHGFDAGRWPADVVARLWPETE